MTPTSRSLLGKRTQFNPRQVSSTEGRDFAKTVGVPFMETSAKTRVRYRALGPSRPDCQWMAQELFPIPDGNSSFSQVNVEECFYELVREIRYVSDSCSGPPRHNGTSPGLAASEFLSDTAPSRPRSSLRG